MRNRSILLRRGLLAAVLATSFCALTVGCGSSGSDSEPPQQFPENPRTVFGGDRPASLQVPAEYDPAVAAPLIVVLHGYGATGALQTAYFGLGPVAAQEGALLIAPDGLVDPAGSQYWNATPACCDFAHTGVDDVAYIRTLIADVSHDYHVDRRRIFLVGHSNGGFMSHRLACEAADQIAAIVSLAGSTFEDASECDPSAPVSILDIHGTDDRSVRYDGSQVVGRPYPGALETLARWGEYDRCNPGPVEVSDTLDLERNLEGAESTILRYTGCANRTEVELWTIPGGSHIPVPAAGFAAQIWRWLDAHPKS